MAFRSIRQRRGRKKLNKEFDLQLTSMMDILIIILVFLLKSYNTSINSFTSSPGLQMPISASMDVPPDSLHVIVTPEGLTFENARILDFVQTAGSAGSSEAGYTFKKMDLDENGYRIVPLYDALVLAREKSELLRSKSPVRDDKGNPIPFDGILAIQADRTVQYDMLRKIMYTAAASGYKVFRFLAKQKEI